MSETSSKPPLRGRFFAGLTLALTIAISAYVGISANKANSIAFASFWFLAVLPAYLCALICYVGDPEAKRPRSFYWLVPPLFTGIVILGSAVFLHEGVICLVMLAPIWVISGWIGAAVLRRIRRGRAARARLNASLLFLPLLCGGIERQIPIVDQPVMLTRSIVIDATPATIWPYAVANSHIREDEGRWNMTQDLFGVPRRRRTALAGQGVGAVRTAYWGDRISFEERITKWCRVDGWAGPSISPTAHCRTIQTGISRPTDRS